MCSPSPPTPLPRRHQRPELILCGPGSTPVGDHLPHPPPAALMHREQLGEDGRALTAFEGVRRLWSVSQDAISFSEHQKEVLLSCLRFFPL